MLLYEKVEKHGHMDKYEHWLWCKGIWVGAFAGRGLYAKGLACKHKHIYMYMHGHMHMGTHGHMY